MFDLISIGDTTIDTFIQISDAEIVCDAHKERCKICFDFGQKIPVEKLIHLVAGNAANNAVGGKRLGLKTAIYTNIGDDSSGQDIAKRFLEEKVDSRYVINNAGMESNFSAVLNFKGDRTIFVYHQDWKYRLPELDRSRWLYYTSVGASFSDSNLVEEVINYLQRTGARLMYSPGTYQLKRGVKKYPQLLALAEVFNVNKEEAKKILGYQSDEVVNVKKLLKQLNDLGPKVVIITDGPQGVFATDGMNFYQMDAFPATVLETTGAGDGFAIGVLAALFYGRDLTEALRWGSANSASVIEQIGPQAGLLTREKIQQKLKENGKIVADVF